MNRLSCGLAQKTYPSPATHVHSAILRQIDHLPRQEPVPEEPLIRTLPEWRLARALPRILQLLLSLQRVGQVPAVREPELGALQPLLHQRNQLLLDGVVQDRRRRGQRRERQESEVGREVDLVREQPAGRRAPRDDEEEIGCA